MADRIEVDGCMVVNRVELEAAVDATTKGANKIGFRHGAVGALIVVAGWVGVRDVVGLPPMTAGGLVFTLLFAATASALLWRIWDASDATFTLGHWSVADFAVHLKNQWESEVDGGRADG